MYLLTFEAKKLSEIRIVLTGFSLGITVFRSGNWKKVEVYADENFINIFMDLHS